MMRSKNPRIETAEGVANQGMTNTIGEEVHETLKGIKCGNAVKTEGIPVEAGKGMGKCGVQLL